MAISFFSFSTSVVSVFSGVGLITGEGFGEALAKTSFFGDGLGVGFGVGFGVGLGVGFGVECAFGVGVGFDLGVDVDAGDDVRAGLAVSVGNWISLGAEAKNGRSSSGSCSFNNSVFDSFRGGFAGAGKLFFSKTTPSPAPPFTQTILCALASLSARLQ